MHGANAPQGNHLEFGECPVKPGAPVLAGRFGRAHLTSRNMKADQSLMQEHDAETLINELDSLRRRVLDEHAIVLALAPGEI
jgi:hypothetical protein